MLGLLACNSPKALDQPSEGFSTLSETFQAVGVRGILGGVARNPVSGCIRGMHHATTLATSLADPGMSNLNGSLGPPGRVVRRPGMNIARFEAELDRRVKPLRTRGTLKLLIDGSQFFPTLTQALKTTREPVDVQIYIFDTDDVAVKVADELKAASKRVPVRVLFDDLGSQQASRIAPQSRLPRSFQPPADILTYLKQDSRIDARRLSNIFLTSTHTKIITLGTSRAYIGGMNIGREYRHDWHDMMAEVRGPVVGVLRAEVDRVFAMTRVGGDFMHLFSRSSLPGKNKYKGIPEPPGAFDIRVMHTRAFDPQIERSIHLAIRSAQRRIWIENPYFADDRIVRELFAARARGVDVRVILPSGSNQKLMAASNTATAAELLKHGIRVYSYHRTLHLKAALFDDWAFMGSANFDHLSLHLNEEMNIAYSDPAAVREIESRLFLTDFRDSKELSVNSVKTGLSTSLAEMAADRL